MTTIWCEMTKLSVNINAVAQLRNRRNLPWPDLVGMGRLALEAGADGLTVHPRPDERHIRRDDVALLAELVKDYPGCEYNIEGYPDDRFMDIVECARPHQVTLVPDEPDQATSDHGWDFPARRTMLSSFVSDLRSRGMRVSLFCDADVDMVRCARDIGADRVELYTGPYGACHDDPSAACREIDLLAAAADAAHVCGMGVNAGHDLTLDNVPALIARIPFICEMSIGHCLIADALIYGMKGAVCRYRDALRSG